MRILILTVLAFWLIPFPAFPQSKVMRNLAADYPDALVLMFYHSSLNMLNTDDDPEFARMIRDIEKIKLLRINKQANTFDDKALKALKADLQDHGFAELMIVKSKGYDIGVYIHENDDEIAGFFLLMDEKDDFMAIDVLGSMPVGNVGQLVNKIKEVNELK